MVSYFKNRKWDNDRRQTYRILRRLWRAWWETLCGWCLYCLSALKSSCGHPIHKIFIACGALLRLVSTCLHYRIVLFRLFLPRNFVITYLKLIIIISCLVFITVIFCHIFWCVSPIVLLSLFPFHHTVVLYIAGSESPSAERLRVSLVWQQESELLKYPYTSHRDSGEQPSPGSDLAGSNNGARISSCESLWCFFFFLSPPTRRHYWSDFD